MTTVVMFDFYGTLARAVEWGPPFEDVLARRGLVLPDVAEARWADDGLDHGEHSVDRDAYVRWEHERLRRVASACGAPDGDVEELVSDLYAASKDYRLAAYDEVPDTLADLRRRGLAVAVCSNWDWDLDKALADVGLEGLIDVAVTSAQAGARKPHPRIYETALARAGVPPAGALFVGDTWEPDVEGPRRAGMRAVQVWRPDQHEGPPPPGAIATLAEVGGLL